MKQLKMGVIGTGNMGKNHVRILSDERRFDLIGVFDQSRDCADEVSAQYDVKVFHTIKELLAEVEAVVLAVPSVLHKEVGLQVAEHGVHALIEKPLALNASDAELLSKAFREKNLKLMVGHIERFNPVITELLKVLDRGTVFYIEAHRYSPFSGSGRITDTSVVEDLMIHDIDLVLQLMSPAEPAKIQSAGMHVMSHDVDFASCVLTFDNAHAVINASRVSQEKERTIRVHSKDREIVADLLAKSLAITQNTDILLGGEHENTYRQNGVVQKIFVPAIEPLKSELLSFYDAVVEDKPIAVSGEDAASAIRICEAVKNQIEH